MARRKLSDVAKPDPIVYEDDAGNPIFTMPKRFMNLSQVERSEYEQIANEQLSKARALAEHMQGLEGRLLTDGVDDETGKRLRAEMGEARFGLLQKIIPDMTKAIFDTLSDAVINELISEFTTAPFPVPTEDPVTSASAAT